MVEGALDCIITIDHDGMVIEFNPAAQETFGYSREEMLGKELAELIVPPAFRSRHRKGLARYAETGAGPFLGRRVDPHAAEALHIPGRLERRSEEPLEIWDGAHNLAGIGYLLPRLPARRFTIVASILADKKVEPMLAALSPLGETLVATTSSNARAVPAGELAALAREHFANVEVVAQPAEALARARELAGSDGAVLITGSLYLLADLSTDA